MIRQRGFSGIEALGKCWLFVYILAVLVLLIYPPLAESAPQDSTQRLELLGVEPAADAVIAQRQPSIRVRLAGADLDPATISFELDGIDVSTQAKLDSLGVVYTPLTKLKGGLHTARFQAKTRDGFEVPPVEWSFTIRRFAKIIEAGGLGTLSGHVERLASGELEEGAKRYRADANFNLNYGLLSSPAFHFNSLSNLRFQTRPPFDISEVDLANLSLTVKVGPTFLSVGDVVVHESDLALANLARRGVQLRVPFAANRLEVNGFMVRSESIVGLTHGFGIGNPDQRIDGGAVKLAPLSRRETLQLRYVALSAKNLTNDGYTFGGFTRGYQNSLHSLGASTVLFDGRLLGGVDVAWSDFDANAADGFSGDRDHGLQFQLHAVPLRANLLAQPAEVRVGLEGERIGTFFKSMGNPFLQPDRQGLSATAMARWGGVSLSGGWSAFNDNVKELAQLPRVDNDAYSLGFNFDPGVYSTTSERAWRWLPRVMLGYTESEQISSREPQQIISPAWPGLYPAFPRVDNQVIIVNSSAGYDWEKLSLYVDWSRASNEDNTNRQPDIRDIGAGLRIGARLSPNLSLGPGLMWNITTSRASNNRRLVNITRTVTPSLTFQAAVIPGALTVQSHSSYTRVRDSNRSIFSSGFNGSLQFDWHADELFGVPGKQTVALRGVYFNSRSRIAQTFLIDRYQVFLLLNWVLPI
jgi:hypothetical protein